MKNKILMLIALTVILGCSPTAYPKFDYNNGPNPWVNAFKDQVFFASLRESYKNDTIFSLIERKDALNPYDGLSLEALQKAKQLGKDLVKKMPPPAMCDGCTAGMNYYMANALHYYNSRDLDSIAKSEYKKYQRTEIK
ncbi:hypothetical protein [Mucilaginibacter sp.]|jgi:hypothetical protein|uniref:hypothetical protein n=1 Tax=Mucilaginibacter sp. TaxID=1882438 RepID=UPI003568CCEA